MQMFRELCVSLVVYVSMPTAIFPNASRFFRVVFQLTARSQRHHAWCSPSWFLWRILLSVFITSPDNHQRS